MSKVTHKLELRIDELPQPDRHIAERLAKIEHEKLAICFAAYLEQSAKGGYADINKMDNYIDALYEWTGVETE